MSVKATNTSTTLATDTIRRKELALLLCGCLPTWLSCMVQKVQRVTESNLHLFQTCKFPFLKHPCLSVHLKRSICKTLAYCGYSAIKLIFFPCVLTMLAQKASNFYVEFTDTNHYVSGTNTGPLFTNF